MGPHWLKKGEIQMRVCSILNTTPVSILNETNLMKMIPYEEEHLALIFVGKKEEGVGDTVAQFRG